MNAIAGWSVFVIALLVAGVCLAPWLRRRGESTPTARAQLIFTNHVRQRMTERNVERRQIEFVITAPQREARDTKNNSVRLERDVDGKTLIVWVAEPWPAAQSVVIKTTAWSSPTIEFSIPPAVAGLVVGRAGSTIRQIEAEHEARISVSRTGVVRVSTRRPESAESAKRQILAIVNRAGASLRTFQAA